MGDDPGHGVAAAVVVAEDLAEEAPDGGDRAEKAVAVLDAVLVERLEDAAFGQGVGEGKSLVARKRARTSFSVVIGRPPMSFGDRFVRADRDSGSPRRQPEAAGQQRCAKYGAWPGQAPTKQARTGLASCSYVIRFARPESARSQSQFRQTRRPRL